MEAAQPAAELAAAPPADEGRAPTLEQGADITDTTEKATDNTSAASVEADNTTAASITEPLEELNQCEPEVSATEHKEVELGVASNTAVIITTETITLPLQAPEAAPEESQATPQAALATENVSQSIEMETESNNAVTAHTTIDATSNAEAEEGSAPAIESITKPIEMETEETANDIPVMAPKETTTAGGASNGLSLLAAYDSGDNSDSEEVNKISDSDNETEDVVEVPVSSERSNKQYRKQVINVSSGSESDSTDSDSEGEYLTVLRKEIDKKIQTEECDEEDEEDEEGGTRSHRRQPPKVRGELLLDELPPIDQLEITVPEDECVELGKVQSIVDQLVLVSVLPNSMLFDLETVLFLDKGRKVLGAVFDVLGQVADPLYCVRFNSNQQIKERGIQVGDVVYCAPKTEHTQFVILSKLMQVRGSDASWEHDVEPPSRYIDYSDDEAERDARWEARKKRQRERTNSTDSIESAASSSTVTSVATTSTAPPNRQRGRRGNRDSYPTGGNYQNQNQQQNAGHQDNRSRSHSRDSQQYNYHPSYNPGSWHSNYYHNYHQPAANFNMPPPPSGPVHFPMPGGYGYGMPSHPPLPYGMPPPQMMPMGMPPPPTHMYPPYGPPPPPNSGR